MNEGHAPFCRFLNGISDFCCWLCTVLRLPDVGSGLHRDFESDNGVKRCSRCKVTIEYSGMDEHSLIYRVKR